MKITQERALGIVSDPSKSHQERADAFTSLNYDEAMRPKLLTYLKKALETEDISTENMRIIMTMVANVTSLDETTKRHFTDQLIKRAKEALDLDTSVNETARAVLQSIRMLTGKDPLRSAAFTKEQRTRAKHLLSK